MTELTTRQMGALILLLILGPLIPTMLLVRLVIITVRTEEARTQEQARELYSHALRVANRSFSEHGVEPSTSSDDLPSCVLEFFQHEFDKDVVLRLVDSDGKRLGGAPASDDPILAETYLTTPVAGWRVEMIGPGDAGRQDTLSEQITSYSWSVAIVIAANLGIAGLAGYAVNRQMRLQELKSSTLATMSHELKTPLASTRLLLETLLAQSDPPREQVREYLKLIAAENRRLTSLTKNFLTVARLERGLFALERVPTAPVEIIEAALEAAHCRTGDPGLEIAIDAPTTLPAIPLDREAMTIALVNLIDNALKCTGDAKKITIRAAELKNRLIIEVADNGIGINPAEQKKIFRRFYQVDQKLSRKHEGCGLGLSIVQAIVRAHGGSVEVTSEEGKGSIFSLSLPLKC